MSCMKAEGFDHVPLPSKHYAAVEISPEGLEWGTVEWMMVYGLGISTQAIPDELTARS